MCCCEYPHGDASRKKQENASRMCYCPDKLADLSIVPLTPSPVSRHDCSVVRTTKKKNEEKREQVGVEPLFFRCSAVYARFVLLCGVCVHPCFFFTEHTQHSQLRVSSYKYRGKERRKRSEGKDERMRGWKGKDALGEKERKGEETDRQHNRDSGTCLALVVVFLVLRGVLRPTLSVSSSPWDTATTRRQWVAGVCCCLYHVELLIVLYTCPW